MSEPLKKQKRQRVKREPKESFVPAPEPMAGKSMMNPAARMNLIDFCNPDYRHHYYPTPRLWITEAEVFDAMQYTKTLLGDYIDLTERFSHLSLMSSDEKEEGPPLLLEPELLSNTLATDFSDEKEEGEQLLGPQLLSTNPFSDEKEEEPQLLDADDLQPSSRGVECKVETDVRQEVVKSDPGTQEAFVKGSGLAADAEGGVSVGAGVAKNENENGGTTPAPAMGAASHTQGVPSDAQPSETVNDKKRATRGAKPSAGTSSRPSRRSQGGTGKPAETRRPTESTSKKIAKAKVSSDGDKPAKSVRFRIAADSDTADVASPEGSGKDQRRAKPVRTGNRGAAAKIVPAVEPLELPGPQAKAEREQSVEELQVPSWVHQPRRPDGRFVRKATAKGSTVGSSRSEGDAIGNRATRSQKKADKPRGSAADRRPISPKPELDCNDAPPPRPRKQPPKPPSRASREPAPAPLRRSLRFKKEEDDDSEWQLEGSESIPSPSTPRNKKGRDTLVGHESAASNGPVIKEARPSLRARKLNKGLETLHAMARQVQRTSWPGHSEICLAAKSRLTLNRKSLHSRKNQGWAATIFDLGCIRRKKSLPVLFSGPSAVEKRTPSRTRPERSQSARRHSPPTISAAAPPSRNSTFYPTIAPNLSRRRRGGSCHRTSRLIILAAVPPLPISISCPTTARRLPRRESWTTPTRLRAPRQIPRSLDSQPLDAY
ncbi:hypothetical protein FB45DRAFT_889504 [Roridomyces roridus]|uniref:Uncharacterized protein n=1 Tax=Roridomyces roridus TaxID=1738132 RepID=A0AAD7G346_9AGAR|nr:hypothetical protein FB45DRAFT_889504 [Roridomyces roridus]